MKKLPFLFIASIMLLAACKKNSADNRDATRKLTFKAADQIPNEIIPLLYNDLIRSGLTVQAENLRKDYYQTLSQRKDGTSDLLQRPYAESDEIIMGANLNDRTVPNVGVVLDGNWVQQSGSTQAHVQDLGTLSVNFNAMNGTAPDAFSTTLPTDAQVIGQQTQAKRMQKFSIATLKYGVPDDLGTTYYTPTITLTYQACVQDQPGDGWMSVVSAPNWAGTDLAKRIQSVRIWGPYTQSGTDLTFNDSAPSTVARMFVYARGQQQDQPNGGWLGWQSEGANVGIYDIPKRLQAFQVRAYLIKL